MRKILLFCLFNLITLYYVAGVEEENFSNRQAYNLNGLFRKSLSVFQSFRDLKHEEVPQLIVDLQFSGINTDAELQEEGNLWQNSSKCLDDILYILLNLNNQWALSLIDSFGKPESGILQGHFKWVGDYNECINVHSSNPNSTAGNFHGKYCSVTWSMPIENTSFPFEIGICVPDSCTSKELQSILLFSHVAAPSCPYPVHILAVLGSSITAVKYFRSVMKESTRSSLTINVSEGDPVVYGDNTSRKSLENDDESLLQIQASTTGKENDFLHKLQTFLACFCVFTNGAKLLNTDSTEGQLLCIHGIRFLSMSWVILGHSYANYLEQIGNGIEALRLMDNFPFQVVMQGFYSVDSFFVLSGFLLVYLSMKEFAKTKGSIPWTYFYIHRYIRLTPTYMIALAFFSTLYLYMGSGPFWPDGEVNLICRDNWWRNLLYVNNFAETTEQCMAWSWYLANDMQFFVISPLFLITLWRWPKIGYGLLATFLLACWFSNFFITYHYNLTAGETVMFGNSALKEFDMNQALTKIQDYFNKIYIKPYTRMAPYLIGMLTGYLLFKRNTSSKTKHNLVFICIGWIVATAITLVAVYGLYHRHPSKLASSFYNALHRTAFAVGLSWVIYVCLIGQGGFVNSILSYKLFIPLSRLTYTTYLIHPMIVGGYYAQLKTTFEFSHPTVVFIYLGVMLAAYGISLPVALILESPIVSLEKLIRKSFGKKESS